MLKDFIKQLNTRLDNKVIECERVIERLQKMSVSEPVTQRMIHWKARIKAYEEVAEIIEALQKQMKEQQGGTNNVGSKRK